MAEPVIVRIPDIMSGTPCFRGTRVPFQNLIDYLAGGHSLSEFLRQFPTVTREMAVQALEETSRLGPRMNANNNISGYYGPAPHESALDPWTPRRAFAPCRCFA